MLQRTNMKTASQVDRKWLLVDAAGMVLGRMATQIALVLQGKHRPTYVPHVDTGDFVVVINADKVKFTGEKLDQKPYRHHTQYIGHMKEVKAREMIETRPDEVVRLAVKRMMPKNALGRQMLDKLKVYAGPDHPHSAQNPEPMEI